MTYIEIRKNSGRKRKAKFWESDVIEKAEHGELKSKRTKKDVGERVHKRATRKIMEFDNFFVGRRL